MYFGVVHRSFVFLVHSIAARTRYLMMFSLNQLHSLSNTERAGYMPWLNELGTLGSANNVIDANSGLQELLNRTLVLDATVRSEFGNLRMKGLEIMKKFGELLQRSYEASLELYMFISCFADILLEDTEPARYDELRVKLRDLLLARQTISKLQRQWENLTMDVEQLKKDLVVSEGEEVRHILAGLHAISKVWQKLDSSILMLEKQLGIALNPNVPITALFQRKIAAARSVYNDLRSILRMHALEMAVTNAYLGDQKDLLADRSLLLCLLT
ncbi:hypothetical protein C8Q74DRAFT_1299038 [Fomes fomentarius]|nr:hypothetical protein C8Q74DRAFT_1299038 [Fomes fomentarius]